MFSVKAKSLARFEALMQEAHPWNGHSWCLDVTRVVEKLCCRTEVCLAGLRSVCFKPLSYS